MVSSSNCLTSLRLPPSSLAAKPLPSVFPFTLPDGSSLQVGSPSHLTGFLTFPHKQSPVACYFLPASDLSHSLFGVSPLIRPQAHAVLTNLSCSFFDSPTSSVPFLSGLKAAEADLWHLSVPLAPVAPSLAVAAPLPCSSALFSLQSLPAGRFVAYWHRAFGSPSLFTFVKALTKGFIHGIPLLTAKFVSKYPPLSLSTSFGHLDTLRKGIASTRKTVSPSCLGPVAPLSVLPRISPRLADLQSSFPSSSSHARTIHRSEWSAADLTGRFPITSHLGYEYILLFVHFNYIHFVPLKSRTAASYVNAYRSASKFFSSLSHPLTHIQIDNEISSELTAFFQASSPASIISASRRTIIALTKRKDRFGQGRITSFLSSPLPTSPFLLIAGETFSLPQS
jgi:hypothetical protein